MSNPINRQFLLEISKFDPTAIRAVYPGVTTYQMEPGAIRGWIRAATINQIQISTGSLSRAALQEGTYTKGMINVGFILDPDSTAVVHAREYEAGAVSIDVGDVDLHELYPGNMLWAGISIPEQMLLKEITAHRELLDSNPHMILQGSRMDLEPLIRLTHQYVNRRTSFSGAEAKRQSVRLLSVIRELLSARFNQATHELPYAEGDKWLMHLVKVSHRLATEGCHQQLSLSEICNATGMKSRTLQKYFKDIYGMGPTEYFRARRLNLVRSVLIKADSKFTHVNEIAEEWGFYHLGRFSVRYRRMFGESPSETLNRQHSGTSQNGQS